MPYENALKVSGMEQRGEFPSSPAVAGGVGLRAWTEIAKLIVFSNCRVDLFLIPRGLREGSWVPMF